MPTCSSSRSRTSTVSMPQAPRSHPGSPTFSVLAGLVLGLGLAFLLDYLDDSIKTKDDVERAAHGLATIGVIPAIPTWRTKDDPRLVSASDPTSSAAEAYRSLRTAIQFTAL